MVGPHVVTNGPERRLRDFKYDPSPLPVSVLAPDHKFEWAIEGTFNVCSLLICLNR